MNCHVALAMTGFKGRSTRLTWPVVRVSARQQQSAAAHNRIHASGKQAGNGHNKEFHAEIVVSGLVLPRHLAHSIKPWCNRRGMQI